jgi:hypothetical protein
MGDHVYHSVRNIGEFLMAAPVVPGVTLSEKTRVSINLGFLATIIGGLLWLVATLKDFQFQIQRVADAITRSETADKRHDDQISEIMRRLPK